MTTCSLNLACLSAWNIGGATNIAIVKEGVAFRAVLFEVELHVPFVRPQFKQIPGVR